MENKSKNMPSSREEIALMNFSLECFREAIAKVYNEEDAVTVSNAYIAGDSMLRVLFSVKGREAMITCLPQAMEAGRRENMREDAVRYAVMVTLAATWSYGVELVGPRVVSSAVLPLAPLREATYIFENAMHSIDHGVWGIYQSAFRCLIGSLRLSKIFREAADGQADRG